ncbi:MAG: Crp/Fnr family transcriptional regulator [Bacteroidetes bacterium]|nr:Crp/Fnr family transcriptional regulator [Bacteroidota bacterium]
MKQFFKEIFPVTQTSITDIEEKIEFVDLNKGTVFIEKDKINKKEYLLFSGICKSFLFNADGDEVTLSFYSGNAVLTPHTIRTQHNKSLLYFKTLTPCRLGLIDAENFIALMYTHEDIKNFANQILKNELMTKLEKEIGLLSLSAADRLKNFRVKHTNFENLIPHTDIASYLGITSISISRLRKALIHK